MWGEDTDVSKPPGKKHPWRQDDSAQAKKRLLMPKAQLHYITIGVDSATRKMFEEVREAMSKDLGSNVTANELGRIAIRYYCTSKRRDPSKPGSRRK